MYNFEINLNYFTYFLRYLLYATEYNTNQSIFKKFIYVMFTYF